MGIWGSTAFLARAGPEGTRTIVLFRHQHFHHDAGAGVVQQPKRFAKACFRPLQRIPGGRARPPHLSGTRGRVEYERGRRTPARAWVFSECRAPIRPCLRQASPAASGSFCEAVTVKPQSEPDGRRPKSMRLEQAVKGINKDIERHEQDITSLTRDVDDLRGRAL